MNIHYTNPQFKNLPNELQNHICSYLPQHPLAKSEEEMEFKLIDINKQSLLEIRNQIIKFEQELININNEINDYKTNLKKTRYYIDINDYNYRKAWTFDSIPELKWRVIKLIKQCKETEIRIQNLKNKYTTKIEEFDNLTDNYAKKNGYDI